MIAIHGSAWPGCKKKKVNLAQLQWAGGFRHNLHSSCDSSTTCRLCRLESNTLYNQTSWTTQHALSSDHLPIINIRHDYRLQQNRRTFTNYMKVDWTQFTEDTESAFAQTTLPTNIHTADIIFSNIILMADKHNIPKARCAATAGFYPTT